MSTLKKISMAAFLSTALSCSTIANAYAEDTKEPTNYHFKLSVDNKLPTSQHASTDLAFSALSGVAYLNEHYNTNNNIFIRIGAYYISALIVTTNHEFSGHALKSKEFKWKVNKVSVEADLGGVTHTLPNKDFHFHQNNIVNTAGMFADYALSQKIANNWIENEQQIDPVLGFAYIESLTDQMQYIYSTSAGEINEGNDISNYAKDIEIMYGKNSVTLSKIKSNAWLDALDPVLYFSAYSVITGNKVDFPKLALVDGFAITPFAKMLPTPYGSLEKKFGTYIFTDYTPIKIGFSYGKQSKSQHKVSLDKNNTKLLNYLKYKGADISKSGIFNGLKDNESVKNHSSYTAELSIYKLYQLDKVTFGADLAYWNQPELLTGDPYRAKTKKGWMGILNTTYKIDETFSIIGRAGYKTKGFIPNMHIQKTPIISLGLQAKL